MTFFQSEIVQEEIKRIAELQEKVYSEVFSLSSMNKSEKIEHINLLEELLKKQEILYFRLNMSDDPEAKAMKEQIIEGASSMGYSKDIDFSYVFRNMNDVIRRLKDSLDEE